jgi:hypothetical protein
MKELGRRGFFGALVAGAAVAKAAPAVIPDPPIDPLPIIYTVPPFSGNYAAVSRVIPPGCNNIIVWQPPEPGYDYPCYGPWPWDK